MANTDEEFAGVFTFLNEVGIIQQLANNKFERELPDGLTRSQFSVLNNFVRLGGIRSPAQLAAAFQVTRGAMTNTLQKLHARGCIEIRTNAADGRKKEVTITTKGRRLREQAIRATFPQIDKMRQALDVEDILSLLPVLQRVREYLDQNR